MRGCDLEDANLEGANLEGINLFRVKSGGIKGKPASLPEGWSLKDGVLIKK